MTYGFLRQDKPRQTLLKSMAFMVFAITTIGLMVKGCSIAPLKKYMNQGNLIFLLCYAGPMRTGRKYGTEDLIIFYWNRSIPSKMILPILVTSSNILKTPGI